MSKPVGHLLRDIYIVAELRYQVNEILRASSPDDPAAEAARDAIFAFAQTNNAYSCATQIRAYLEEKTRVGSEVWAFPVAGDLFLEGLSSQLGRLGPNLFTDIYAGMLACYRAGYEPARAAQGPFYCIDLLFKRTILLFLNRQQADMAPDTQLLRFMRPETLGYRGQMQEFQSLNERVFSDATEFLMSPAANGLDSGLTEYLADLCTKLRPLLKRWPAITRAAEDHSGTEAERIQKMLDEVRALGYVPIEALLREELTDLLTSDAPATADCTEDPRVVHSFEAGESWMNLGNTEREHTATLLAGKRYNHAIERFHAIHDRTSEAKALMERARANIGTGGHRALLCDSLRGAVRLVLAHKYNLPQEKLPDVNDKQVHEFLFKKGYTAEAAAFGKALNIPDPGNP